MKKHKAFLFFAAFTCVLSMGVSAQESGIEQAAFEPEYLEWALGFTGLVASIIASYMSVKAFSGMIGKSMKMYAAGIILIGIASIMCFIFYVAGIGEAEEMSVQIEDGLRTAALIIFAASGYMIYRGSKKMAGKTIKTRGVAE